MLTVSKERSQSKLLLELKQLKLIRTASHVLETLEGAPCRTFFEVLQLPRGTARKIRWGCAARFPKPLPYIYDQNLRYSLPYSLFQPTVLLIFFSIKVASRLINILISRLEYKNHTLFMTKVVKIS